MSDMELKCTVGADTTQQAIEAWNRRAEHERI